MLIWNLYFLIKIGLHLTGQLTLSPAGNLALFVALMISNPALYVNKRLLYILRYLVFTGPALALLLHECGLTVSLALVDQIKALFGFSTEYLWELVKRTIQPWMLWGALAGFMMVQVLDRYLRTSAWVGVGLLSLWALQTWPVLQLTGPQREALAEQEQVLQARENLSPAELLALGQADFQRLNAALRQDHQGLQSDSGGNGPQAVLGLFFEQQKSVALQAFSPATAPDFDVILLQICSLSWADLNYAKQGRHTALRQADFLFENFNSATSYSGPAAIRLLRGKCGQQPHDALYNPASSQCMLFEQLRNVGFEVEMGLNHDGLFQNFSSLVKTNLGAQAVQRVKHDAVSTGVLAFDGSRVGRDGDYLRTWWNQRLQQAGPAVAYYYNSITLHDGNRLPNSELNSLGSYPQRLERLLNDIEAVLLDIRRSGRKALVLVVPEHGAGLTGEFGQLVGLRELPTPAITRVPVFGYWIAPGYPGAGTSAGAGAGTVSGPVTVRQPVSYTALSELLSRWLALPADQRSKPAWPVLLTNLPETRLVSQQGNITVMENRGQYWLKAPGTDWKTLGPVTSANVMP